MGIRWIASLTVYGWFLLQQTHGYSSGAPSSQCSLMTPIHSRFPPKTTQIPYQLTAIPDKYRPGEEIIIQLTSAQGNTHKGFLVRTENSMGDAAGTMIPGFDEQKTLNCGANAAGITHSRNTEKQFSSFKWRAPASSTGDVTFYVTVVQDYTTFWVRKVLLVLSEAVESTTEADQTTESTAATTHIDTDHADTTLTQEDQTKTEHQTTPTPLPQTTFVSTTDDSKLTTSFTVEVTTNIFTSVSPENHITKSNSTFSLLDTITNITNSFITTMSNVPTDDTHQTGSMATSTYFPSYDQYSSEIPYNNNDSDVLTTSGNSFTTDFSNNYTNENFKTPVTSMTAEVTTYTHATLIEDSFTTTGILPTNTATVFENKTNSVTTSSEQNTRSPVSKSTGINDIKEMSTKSVELRAKPTTIPNTKKAIVLKINQTTVKPNKDVPGQLPDVNLTPRDIIRLRNSKPNFLTNMFLKPILEKFGNNSNIKQDGTEKTIEAFKQQTAITEVIDNLQESDVITLGTVVLPDVISMSLPEYPWLIDQDGKITFDPECGSSKGCFVKCDGRDCQFMVTWRDLGAGVKFEIYGRPDGGVPDAWVAVGFSADTKMGEDSVTECVHTSGMVQAFNSYNPGYSNTRLPNPQMGLSQIQGNYINGVLMCSFVRDKRVWNIPQVYDLEQDWHIMYANGRALSVPAWSISMHSLSQDNYPQTSAVRVDYQSFVVVGSGAKYPLVKAHGCLMILAWVFFTGVGIVTARYYKNVWVDKSFMKLRIWFQVHRFSMIAAVLCNTIAFIIIFVEVGGYSNIPNIPGKSYLRSHPILGIIITILSITNPIMAFLRPDPEHSKRSIFNWAHWGVGMAAYILSIISICFGFQLGKSHTPEYAIYIMIVYVIYIIMFDISLETMEIMAKRDKKGKVEQVEMSTTTTNGTDSSIPNGNSMSTGKNKKTDRTKTILLAVHFAFTGAFALVLVLVIALN